MLQRSRKLTKAYQHQYMTKFKKTGLLHVPNQLSEEEPVVISYRVNY